MRPRARPSSCPASPSSGCSSVLCCLATRPPGRSPTRVRLPGRPPVRPSNRLPTCPAVRSSARPAVRLPVRPSVRPTGRSPTRWSARPFLPPVFAVRLLSRLATRPISAARPPSRPATRPSLCPVARLPVARPFPCPAAPPAVCPPVRLSGCLSARHPPVPSLGRSHPVDRPTLRAPESRPSGPSRDRN